MPKPHPLATRQLESIAEEERVRVSNDLSRQEQVQLRVWIARSGHDLHPPSRMWDARDFLPIAEDDGPVLLEPDDFHDLADAGGMRSDRLEKTIRSHDAPPLLAREYVEVRPADTKRDPIQGHWLPPLP